MPPFSLACLPLRICCSLLLGSLLVGCQPAADSVAATPQNGPQKTIPAAHQISVLATVGMVADIARNVGGKHVHVVQLMGSGVDPHLYKPSRDDVEKFRVAEIIFYNGLLLEGHLQSSLEQVAKSKPVTAIASVLNDLDVLKAEDGSVHHDPHIWMDVSLWIRGVDPVLDTLTKKDPEHADEFQANAKTYREQLQLLHQYGKQVINSIPAEQRTLITSHDAFRYLGRAYGVKVESIQGVSTESEAGLVRINQLVAMIVERKIATVFVESSVPSKGVEALIEGAKARGQNVQIGGTLFSDAMGSADDYTGTYLGMMDHNFTLLARSMGGTAPLKGFQEKLTIEK